MFEPAFAQADVAWLQLQDQARQWLASPLGQLLLADQQRFVEAELARFFGGYLVHYGPEIAALPSAAQIQRSVRIGDALVVARGEERFEIEVLALSDMRGPASVAQALYRESAASLLARERARAMRAAAHNGFRPPETRPDKRARRLILALGALDAL